MPQKPKEKIKTFYNKKQSRKKLKESNVHLHYLKAKSHSLTKIIVYVLYVKCIGIQVSVRDNKKQFSTRVSFFNE